MSIFEDCFSLSFIPFIKNLNGPKVIIGDNLASHLSLEVIKLCETHNIRFVLLPPNATHLCQPLDLAFFRPLKGTWRKVLDEWKKNRGVFKCLFPEMLKKALNTVESLESNVKAGFMAAGIVPFNKDRVLSRVKSRPEDEEHEEQVRNSSWSQAFVDILQDVRLEDKIVGKKPRGKKVAVEDFGITSEDAEDNEEDIDDPEFDENVLANDENQPSTSGTITIQPESSTDFEIDDFILVRYDTGKSYRKYIGQVIIVDYPLLNVNFLRKKNSLSGSTILVFPTVTDKSRINVSQVVTKVKLLAKLKRQRFVLDIDDSNTE